MGTATGKVLFMVFQSLHKHIDPLRVTLRLFLVMSQTRQCQRDRQSFCRQLHCLTVALLHARLLVDGRERGNCSTAWQSTDFVTDVSAGAFCASSRSSSPLACPARCIASSSRLDTPQCRGIQSPSGAQNALLQKADF
jgi:hypothetical protein